MVWILLVLQTGIIRAQEVPKELPDSVVTTGQTASTEEVLPSDQAPSTKEEKPKKESELKSPVHYQASDSMIMMGNGTAFLHGQRDLIYD